LYKRHLKQHGESIANLPFSRFKIMDDTLLEELPNLIEHQEDGSFKRLTHTLLRELKTKGFAEGANMEYNLTPEGYLEAARLMHPYMHFVKNHWKWLVGAFFTLITISLAIIRVTACK
jgi:hypothetical protein